MLKILISFMILSLSGCGISSLEPSFTSVFWQIQEYPSQKIKLNLKENSFHGNDGCNHIFGSIIHTKNELEFKNIASTKMACLNMQEAYEFVQKLDKTKYFEIKNDTLLLKNKDKEILLIFIKTQTKD